MQDQPVAIGVVGVDFPAVRRGNDAAGGRIAELSEVSDRSFQVFDFQTQAHAGGGVGSGEWGVGSVFGVKDAEP